MVSESQENGKIQEMPSINNANSDIQRRNLINDVSNNNSKVIGWPLYIFYQVIGLLLILFVFLWLQIYRNGYGFSETLLICNWHPLLMTISFTYLFANSILHYRSFHYVSKRTLKITHVVILGSVVIFGCFGLWAGLKSNTIANPFIGQFYSLHSYLGILTCVIFVLQFATGLVSYLYPGVSQQYRKSLMPYHKFFGTLTFALSVVTSVLGFCEKNISARDKSGEGLFINCIGLLLIFYGVSVVYLLIDPAYKRPPESLAVIIHSKPSS